MNNQVHTQIVSFIWSIADDCLRDVYVRGKYRDVILPMTVIRRLDAMLEGTIENVRNTKKLLDEAKVDNQWPALCNAAGQPFCNASPFLLKDLTSRASKQKLKTDFETYLDGFSPNVQEILEKFKFRNQIATMVDADILGSVIEKFVSSDINLSPNPVYKDDEKTILKHPGLDNHGMGTIFEELIRKFNEENNEEAGEHWTPRDVVELMADLIFMSRAIAILDTVFKSIESLGGSINSDLSVKIRDDIVRFRMVESQDQVKHEMTKQEAQELVKYNDDIKNHRWASKPQIRKYDKVYNGKLRIEFGERSYIRDKDSEKLEDRLGDILVTLYEKAEENRIVREAREEAERNGATVLYGSASELRATLDYDFAEEKKFSYKNLSMEEIIHHLAFFVSRLWQIHVFGEGNTRTTAVFFIKYLRTLGFDATNDIFAENAWYFRNALVRANYNDLKNGVHETTEYLELFLRNLLLDEKNELHNRTMHISGRFAEVDIERVKVDIKSGEVDIESTKVDIRNKLLSFSDTISEKTINHTVEIFSKCGKENCFGRTIVEEITGLKPSRASKLIKLLVDSEVIVPVTGHGKGKYRFQ